MINISKYLYVRENVSNMGAQIRSYQITCLMLSSQTFWNHDFVRLYIRLLGWSILKMT